MQIAQTDAPIIEVQHLYKDFPVNSNAIKSGKMRALSDITFNLHRGRALAVVGESGSGKSTIAKIIAKMYKLSGGRILYRVPRPRGVQQGHRPARLPPERADGVARSVRFAEPDPYHLPPHRSPLLLHSKVIDKRDLPDMVYGLLEKVGLTPAKATAAKYPHQLSGGQRQRVNIARNLAVEAEVVLADEPTSMLDVSIRIGILNLMEQMKDELGVSMLYITHDIATARYVAEDLAVMYVGHMVEWGEVDEILHHPQHPYTQLLISAVPDPEKSIHAELEGAARGDPALDAGILRLPVCRALQSGDAPLQGDPAPVSKLADNHFVRCYLYHDRPARTRRPATPRHGAVRAPQCASPRQVSHRSKTLMELLINQVGYQCDGEKIALLQSDTDLDIRGHLRLLRQDDERILLEVPLQPTGQVEGWQGRHYWRADFSPAKSPATTGWRPSSRRVPRSASCAPPPSPSARICWRAAASDVIHYFKAARQRRLRSGRPQRPPVWQ